MRKLILWRLSNFVRDETAGQLKAQTDQVDQIQIQRIGLLDPFAFDDRMQLVAQWRRAGGRHAGAGHWLTSWLVDATAAVSNETQGRRARLLSSGDAHFAASLSLSLSLFQITR